MSDDLKVPVNKISATIYLSGQNAPIECDVFTEPGVRLSDHLEGECKFLKVINNNGSLMLINKSLVDVVTVEGEENANQRN